MKRFRFFTCVTLLIVSVLASLLSPDTVLGNMDRVMMKPSSRKLKEGLGYTTPTPSTKSSTGIVKLEDYHPIDPAPRARASVSHGSIVHGVPIIPHIPERIPQYSPRLPHTPRVIPGLPKHGGSP